MFGVRLWGTVTVIRHAIARLSPAGSITLTTGTVGQRPIPGAALAAAGAGAAEALVQGLAVEPEQIAMAHLYLMRNGHVTGTVLGVNGGSLLTAG